MDLIKVDDTKAVEAILSSLKDISLEDLESRMKTMEQVHCPVVHEFADGVYSRITAMPAGTLAIGKRHRYRTYNILLEGEITVYMGDNEPVRRLVAPCTFVSGAMVRKVAYFHKDTVWVNIHPTDETDLDRIEDMFIIPEEEYRLLLEPKEG